MHISPIHFDANKANHTGEMNSQSVLHSRDRIFDIGAMEYELDRYELTRMEGRLNRIHTLVRLIDDVQRSPSIRSMGDFISSPRRTRSSNMTTYVRMSIWNRVAVSSYPSIPHNQTQLAVNRSAEKSWSFQGKLLRWRESTLEGDSRKISHTEDRMRD